MTLKEIVDTLMMDLDEKPSDTAMVKKLKAYINRGYKELCKKENLEKKNISVAEGNKLKRPSGLIRITSITKDGFVKKYNVVNNGILVDEDGEYEIVYNFNADPLEGDDDETITNPANDEFIINYAKWLYCLSEGLEDTAPMYKQEYQGLRIVVASKMSKISDVYGVG